MATQTPADTAVASSASPADSAPLAAATSKAAAKKSSARKVPAGKAATPRSAKRAARKTAGASTGPAAKGETSGQAAKANDAGPSRRRTKAGSKPLAKATPVAPWPPAAVTGGPVNPAAPAQPAMPAARTRQPGAPVAAKPGPKKLSPKVSSRPAKRNAPGTGGAAKPSPKRGKVAAPQSADKSPKLRVKLVRDSFTMPQVDFDLIDALKKRALAFQRPAKKSELLRAGLQALAALDDRQLGALLESLPLLKPGRPKKGD